MNSNPNDFRPREEYTSTCMNHKQCGIVLESAALWRWSSMCASGICPLATDFPLPWTLLKPPSSPLRNALVTDHGIISAHAYGQTFACAASGTLCGCLDITHRKLITFVCPTWLRWKGRRCRKCVGLCCGQRSNHGTSAREVSRDLIGDYQEKEWITHRFAFCG